MGFGATAQAQTEVWSGTLTVQDLGNLLGCSNAIEGARCRDTAILTDDDFTYDSTDYVVHNLFLHVGPAGRLEISFIPDLATAAQALTLDVAGTTFAFEDADVKEERQRVWASTGLSWSGGDTVAVKLTETPTSTNNAPIFTDGTSTTRSVAENTTASTNIGTAIAATDADSGDTLRYTLGGTDMASFAIVSTSGQLRTQAALDFETKSSYAVTVSVSDGNGGSDSIGVTITVTDVDEKPATPAAPTVSATANSHTSLDVSWTAPGLNGGPAITGYHLQYRQGTTGSFTNGPQNVSGTSAMIAGLTAGTSYQVQVRALNGETPSDWSPAGTGSSSTPAQPTLTLDVGPNRFSEDAGTVTICVVPSAVSSQRITVQVATADGTATAPDDYVSHSGTVALQPQQQRACFTVTLVDDAEAEGDETFTVRLSNPVNATLGGARAVATFTIVDDDGTDRDVLVAFYNATGGPNWTDNTNWLSQEPLSEWHGVRTNGDGRVTELYLPSLQLSGEIPAELGDLTSLWRLYLNDNQLTGTIPAALGGLTNLQWLFLYNNQLSGEIPVELGDLTSLQQLWLSGNQLSGEIPAELGNLTSLQRLQLNVNQFDGEIPEELGQLTSLEILDLANNQLTGTIPAELGNLTNLRFLDLNDNQLTGTIPAALGGLTNLQQLILYSNQLDGEIPAELGGLTSLQRLYLYDNQLTMPIPEELGNLGSLQFLYLYDNQLSGEIPAELGSLTSLQRLRLNVNQLDGEIPAALGGLTNLQWLILDNNQLDGEIPAELGGLTSLQRLYLYNNQLDGEIPAELGNLTSLQRLQLNVNQFDGEIPEELGGLTSLQFLLLDNNQLSGEIPVELGNLASLQELYLNDNQLSGPLPLSLSALSQLSVLDIKSTALCAPVDAAFQAWLAMIDFRGSACGTRTPPGGGGGGGGGGGPRTSAPGAVRNLTVAGGDGQVVLTWDAPASDGGAAITDYEYRYRTGGSYGAWISIGSTDTTHTVTGLDNGTAYTFQVRAVNRIGKGRTSNRADAAPGGGLGFAHFANGDGTTSDLVFVNVAPQPVQPALYFYDKEGNPIDPGMVVEISLRRSGGHRGRSPDGPDGDGAAGRTHDFDPRSGRSGERIGEGGRGRSHRRGPAL